MMTTTTVAVSFKLPKEHEVEQSFRMNHDMRDWICTECTGMRTYTKMEQIFIETGGEND